MTSRERVEAALAFEPVDKAPLEYHPCGRGLYEHGEAFRRLLKAHPGAAGRGLRPGRKLS